MQIKTKLKVAIVGSVGIPANYGGFETLAEQLIRELNTDIGFTVYCSSKSYKIRPKKYANARLKYLPFRANGITSILYDTLSILDSLFFADIILVLGVSSGFMIPLIQLLSSKKVIVNVDGQEWKRAKWNYFARKYLQLQEAIAVKYSDTVIADNIVIQENLLHRYNVSSRLIAYGGSHTRKNEISPSELEQRGIERPYYLSVCRIEPENNIHIILKAFSETNESMIFVGNWDSSNYGRKLRKSFSKVKNIQMLDPIYDQNELDKLRSNCKVYVHGHSAGGTNPSLVEAMYLQLPIFAWNVNYNHQTTQKRALYFDDVQSLVRLISENTDEVMLKTMAKDLFHVAETHYKWKNISKAYLDLFIH